MLDGCSIDKMMFERNTNIFKQIIEEQKHFGAYSHSNILFERIELAQFFRSSRLSPVTYRTIAWISTVHRH